MSQAVAVALSVTVLLSTIALSTAVDVNGKFFSLFLQTRSVSWPDVVKGD